VLLVDYCTRVQPFRCTFGWIEIIQKWKKVHAHIVLGLADLLCFRFGLLEGI
jgi:hypothetical protein